VITGEDISWRAEAMAICFMTNDEQRCTSDGVTLRPAIFHPSLFTIHQSPFTLHCRLFVFQYQIAKPI